MNILKTSEVIHGVKRPLGYIPMQGPCIFLFYKMSVEVLIKFFVEGKDEIIMHAFPAHDVERQFTISSAYSNVRRILQFVCVHSSWQFSILRVPRCYFLTSVRPSTSQRVLLHGVHLLN